MSHQVLDRFIPPFAEPMARLIDGARADLAARQQADPAAIEVEGVYAVIWSDGSIGCPRPGMLYTQALVEGALIILRLGGASYSYHSDRGRPAFLCQP